ncbi:MAG: C40 family peptidase [Clostridia bacterium]|nr:C40 family peptidase [Clostridia bacterium]
MNRLKTIFAIGALALSLQATASAADLSEWAVNDYIEANATGLLSYKIMSGDLRSNITREEFCELAINLYEKITNEDLRIPDESPFVDCDNVAVSQAYYNGIVSGVSDNEFEPGRPVTRQEMAVMLVNVLNAAELNVIFNTGEDEKAIQDFVDHKQVSEWAKAPMTTMINYSLLSGNDDNEIMPLDNTTREQAMACVNRCYKTFTEINQDRYMLPILTAPADFVSGDTVVAWGEIESATGYDIIVKNENGEVVYSSTVPGESYVEIIAETEMEPAEYSVVVGAKMPSGDTVFSVPSDFEVRPGVVESVTDNSRDELSKPIINYDNEVLTDKAKAVLAEADKYLGIKYVYGGTTPAGFDCSGFVRYVFDNCGVSLKRVSRDQYAYNGTSVAKTELQPGDLVFFGSGGYVSHVGIYAGGGQMIHSPSTGKSICYTSINSNYYLSHYIGAKRVLN